MARVTEFASSGQGQMYAALCERFNRDPAASFTDDVLAVNFLAALALKAAPAEPNDWEAAAVANEREWLSA